MGQAACMHPRSVAIVDRTDRPNQRAPLTTQQEGTPSTLPAQPCAGDAGAEEGFKLPSVQQATEAVQEVTDVIQAIINVLQRCKECKEELKKDQAEGASECKGPDPSDPSDLAGPPSGGMDEGQEEGLTRNLRMLADAIAALPHSLQTATEVYRLMKISKAIRSLKAFTKVHGDH